MNTINIKKISISIIRSGLAAFILLSALMAASAQTPVRASYDSNPYVDDPTNKDNPYKWNGGLPATRIIYNPLDGGILLKYTMNSQANADGCSRGAPRELDLFKEACLAHDTNYDAPFTLAGFPRYPGGGSTGQDIADYVFYKDMQVINNNARAKNDGLTNWVNDSAADSFYMGVVLGGNFRGRSEGKQVLEKGGVVAVMNNGAYIMTLKVTWTGPDRVQRTVQVTKPVGQTAVVPLSKESSNITIQAWAVAGTTIFSKSVISPGMYAFTVTGTTLINSYQAGLKDNAKNTLNAQECDRCIKFFCQAGYVADMTVLYTVNENVGGTVMPTPKIFSTGKITAGISKSIDIPKNLAPNTRINVVLTGYGTFKNNFYSTTVDANFTGQKCFKAWGTIFDPTGGDC